MKIIVWTLRLLFCLLLVLFALYNTEPVTLYIWPGQFFQGPLVIHLLAFFVMGVAFGMLLLVSLIYRQRRELGRLKRRLAESSKPVETLQNPL